MTFSFSIAIIQLLNIGLVILAGYLVYKVIKYLNRKS